MQTEMTEILIPYHTAKTQYGKQVADMMQQLADSEAAEAKRHKMDEFRFYLVYNVVEDPKTDSEEEFIRQVVAKTKTSVQCRGWRFKSTYPIDSIPDNVLNRITERAKLICQSKPHEATPIVSTLEAEILIMCSSIDDMVLRFGLDPRFAHVSKEAILQYKQKQ